MVTKSRCGQMREYALKPELVEVEVDTAEYEEVIKGVLKFQVCEIAKVRGGSARKWVRDGE